MAVRAHVVLHVAYVMLVPGVIVDIASAKLYAYPCQQVPPAAGIVTQPPVVGWNVANDFASLKLHSSDRFASRGAGFNLDGVKRWGSQTVLYFSPFLLWPLLKSETGRWMR